MNAYIPCCPNCKGSGLDPVDGNIKKVKDMRFCPTCHGSGNHEDPYCPANPRPQEGKNK